MLNLPEKVENFDYNLKLAVDNIPGPDGPPEAEDKSKMKEINYSNENETKIEFQSDAFLMVTQMNWEEEVIWNGDDIKHKVLQKLNSKTNAAGWVPSHLNRTAGSFGQG